MIVAPTSNLTVVMTGSGNNQDGGADVFSSLLPKLIAEQNRLVEDRRGPALSATAPETLARARSRRARAAENPLMPRHDLARAYPLGPAHIHAPAMVLTFDTAGCRPRC